MSVKGDDILLARERVFLRVPSKFRANVLIDNRYYTSVSVRELSSRGLSFLVGKKVNLPEAFELRFRLPHSFRPMKTKVEVKNRQDLRFNTLIGGNFSDITDNDRNLIIKYIIRVTDISAPYRILNIAAFLLFMDALYRLFVYMLSVYYGNTEFGKGLYASQRLFAFYGVALLFYASVSFGAFILTENPKKKGFEMALGGIGAVFIFILLRHIELWKSGLWRETYGFFSFYFWSQFAIVFFAASSVVFGTLSVSRVRSVFRSLTYAK